MNELILHHYPASPYAEKVRLMLGFKGLAWRSVRIPEVMPKPDVLALTGGYRRTPILQIGADIYCDTEIMIGVIEQARPKPCLFAGNPLADRALRYWAEGALFNLAVPLVFQGAAVKEIFPDWGEAELQRFREDRAAMRKGGTVRRGPLYECDANLRWIVNLLEAQLADGRLFLLGERACPADFAVYHPLWQLRSFKHLLPALPQYFGDARIGAWMDRIGAFGHGEPKALSSAEAIEVARSSEPAPIAGANAVATGDVKLHDEVEVMPVDYALDTVRGKLMRADASQISVLRSDPRAGNVMVHFPRFGYQLSKAA